MDHISEDLKRNTVGVEWHVEAVYLGKSVVGKLGSGGRGEWSAASAGARTQFHADLPKDRPEEFLGSCIQSHAEPFKNHL